jgi:polyphosphate kinase
VRSILGRFLEHSRVYAFANSSGPAIGDGAETGPEIFIGSADLMHRNLDRRVETLVRITDPDQVEYLLWLLDTSMSEDVASWHLAASGDWTRVVEGGEPPHRLDDLQEILISRQRQQVAAR